MFDDSRSFVTRAFLRSALDLEFRAYCEGDQDSALLARLKEWDQRLRLSEKQAETAFIQTFFVETWSYGETGRVEVDDHTLIPKLRIAGEGAGGGSGEVDLAAGWFKGRLDATPQVLCEFKDIRSALDAKQNRKGSNRSPVQQCLDYLRGARRNLFGNEPVQPWWGVVTDMNEFRLYWWDRAPSQCARFVIRRPNDLFREPYDLLTESDDAKFDRFLFRKLFNRDYLISEAGRPALLRLVEKQWIREEALEDEFYKRYKAVRERLFSVIRVNNPDFPGTATELLRLTQKLLDRFIFAFYCEDMGERMLFPPQFVRDYLKVRCSEPYYDAAAEDFWPFFRRLFTQMNTGGMLGKQQVPFINGGLFAPDPAIDNLSIPNHVFAAHEQGRNEASLESDRDTIFYLSARYNYAARGDIRESVSLYTLGRIFEQSITELEYRAGELEGRDTIAKLSKRKRDGVYYTPEAVVNYLVEGTLGPWFAETKRACGYEEGLTVETVGAYEKRLKTIRIVDPACGSGAFLISAFRRLLDERLAVARERETLSGAKSAIAEQAVIAEILSTNIYGVDINPAAVEIAKLALWLHSARANSPLSSLDLTIRCGNSLVGPDFWAGRAGDENERERVNAFDWQATFPEIFKTGGFDIVLGNPPYVKLQNLRKVHPNVADYLQANRGDDTYVSAQTGNFDLYLPFIEKGLRLLAPGGRMAYIAPSLWAVNEYGAGLRRLVSERRTLDRWVDFKAHQVFKEAITYTALQFFTRAPNDAVRIAVAPDGNDSDIDWTSEDLAVDYKALQGDGEWLIATGEERALIDRLARDCKRLDDKSVAKGIIVGIQTSADSIYHLRRVAPGRYACAPKDVDQYEVEIEDEIMKPLVSGPEAKRYETPETETYLLFPYARNERAAMKLIPVGAMAKNFPLAWKYLKSWEMELRAREGSSFDDEEWYRFGRNQNIDKQDCEKLIIPRLVEHLKSASDGAGATYLDNVDVGGVIPANGVSIDFLNCVLNGPVADFVFRRIAKPFRGDYRSANKQFIAPLPIPNATKAEAADIARRAKSLQTRWTKRRKFLAAASERLGVLPRAKWKARQLWTDLPDLAALADEAPKAFKLKTDKRQWAETRFEELEAAKLAALQAALDTAQHLSADFRDGELRLLSGSAPVLSRIFLDAEAGAIALAYWNWLLISQPWNDAARLAKELRRPPSDSASPAARQFIQKVADLAALGDEIAAEEAETNALLYRLYGLSDDERSLVEKDRKALLL